MKKRALSFIVMCFCVFECLSLSAFIVSAKTTKTRAQAISWVQGLNGQKVGSGQCVALIKEYYSYLGYTSPGGNACDYATNQIPSGSGWVREKGGVPNPGDILIYTGSKYGHVAIHESDNVSWHENWGGLYVQRVSRNYKKSFSYNGQTNTYWGCIHIDFADSTPHTHSYNTYVFNWAAHPHYKCYKCSCGEIKENVNETTYSSDCFECINQNKTSSSDDEQVVKDGLYTVKNVSSGYMLNVYGGKDVNGTKVTTWEYDGTTDQRIYIQYQGNGKYLLKFNASYGGRVVDVNRGESLTASIDDGDKIDIWTANDLDAQYFYINSCGDGSYTFELVSKANHVISAIGSAAAASNGTQLELKKYSGAAYQKWYLCDINGNRVDACAHNRISQKNTNTEYEKLNDSQHIRITYYNNVCGDCGEITQSNMNTKENENHTIKNNKCSKCGYEKENEAEYKPIEEEKSCEHTRTYEADSSKESEVKEQKDSKYHIVCKYVDLICSDCKKTLEKDVEKTFEEEHLFVEDGCAKCGYENDNKKAEASVISTNKSSVKAGDSVELTWTKAEYAKTYDLHIYKDGTRINLIASLETLSYTYKFAEVGTYGIRVCSINKNGEFTEGNQVTVVVSANVVEKTGYVYNTEGANLNMRSKADINSYIVVKMPEYSSLTVTGDAVNGFYPVKYGDYSGYASTAYITFAKPVISVETSENLENKIGKRLAYFNNGAYGSISPLRGYKGQCTWYCWGRAYEKTGIRLNTVNNAKTWLNKLNTAGTYVVWNSYSPRKNSIGVKTSGTYGHVLFIEDVVGDTVYYTEANVPWNDVLDATDGVLKKTTKANMAKMCNGYIYLN